MTHRDIREEPSNQVWFSFMSSETHITTFQSQPWIVAKCQHEIRFMLRDKYRFVYSGISFLRMGRPTEDDYLWL